MAQGVGVAQKSPLMERELMRSSQPKMAPVQYMVISVVDGEGVDMQLKIKNITPFGSVFKTVERQRGVSQGTYRFHFDGQRLQHDQTPADVGMKEGDTIDCLMEQMGG